MYNRSVAQFSRNPYSNFNIVFWADSGHENRGERLLFGGTDFKEIRTAAIQQLKHCFRGKRRHINRGVAVYFVQSVQQYDHIAGHKN